MKNVLIWLAVALDRVISIVPFQGQRSLVTALAILIVERTGLPTEATEPVVLVLGGLLTLFLMAKPARVVAKKVETGELPPPEPPPGAAMIVLALIPVLAACGGREGEVVERVRTEQGTNLARVPLSLPKKDFRCDEFLASIEALPTWNVVTLFRTFGEERGCLERLLGDSRFQGFELNLINDTCFRNGRRCGRQEFNFGRTAAENERLALRRDPRFLADVRRFFRDAKRWAGPALDVQTCLISPLLEANYSPAAGAVLVETARAIFGDRCLIVWNPVRPADAVDVGQDITEVHGFRSSPGIANNDGEWDGYEVLEFFLRQNRTSALRAAWHPADNCFRPGPFVDPRHRDCSEQEEAFPRLGAVLAGVFTD